MEAVYLVLVYAVLMSFWWVLMKILTNLKVEVDGITVSFPNNLIRFASGMGAGVLVIWSLARHGGYRYLSTLPPQFWTSLSVVICLNIVLAYLYLKAVQKSVISVAVHVTLLSPVVAIFTSYFLGVDRIPGSATLAGIAIVLGGLYVLHFDPKKFGRNLAGPLLEIWQERGSWLWYSLGIAACGGLAIPLDKRCVLLSDNALAPGLTLFIAWGLCFGVAGWKANDFHLAGRFPRRKVLSCLVLLGVFFGIANGFQAEAYRYQYAAAVASLKRLDAPFTVLWAWFLFTKQEQSAGHFGFRMIGSFLAFGGAVLIGVSKLLT